LKINGCRPLIEGIPILTGADATALDLKRHWFREGRIMKKYLVAAALAALISPTAAQADGYFEGKTITYIIATDPGGGYDTYGRLVGKYLEKHLNAGNVIFKNLPGAGHIVGANTLAAAEPDGLTIGTFNTGLIYAQVLQRDGVQFDLAAMSWIGKAAADPRVMILGTESGLNSYEDLKNSSETARFAASGVGSASYTDTNLIATALDLNIEIIPGYNGNEGEMAMLRNEVVGQVGSHSSLKPFVDAGSGTVVLGIGGSVEPQAVDLATTDKGRAIAALVQALSELGRLMAAPSGVPDEILQELRDAYWASVNDPELLADAEQLGIPINPATGAEVAELVKAALNQSPENVAIIAAAVDVQIPTLTVTAPILSLEDENRWFEFVAGDETLKAKISGSRTKLTINGAEEKRKNLVVGMVCEIEYDPNHEDYEPKAMACSGDAMAAEAPAEEEEGAKVEVTAEILSLEDENKWFEFVSGGDTLKSKISGSRTMLTIDGAEEKRKNLVVGMVCDIAYDPDHKNLEPSSMACATSIATVTVTAPILSLEDENRWIEFESGSETIKAKISGSRTMLTIDGAEEKRKKLVVGMVCEIEYDPENDKNEPKAMACKS
jgi:tripartite-type tricarboxylate transporter receptor subunit TctC